jgi:hypothetical protein
MKAPIRNCEKCIHFVQLPEKKRAHCARGKKLHFIFPKLSGLQHPDTWGYRTSCNLFVKASQPKPAPTHPA